MPFIDDQKTLSANKLSRSSLYLTFDSSGSLARLSIPDVVFYDGSLVNSTTYSDLYRVTCRLDSRSHGKSVVAVKRLRIHEKDDIVSVRLPCFLPLGSSSSSVIVVRQRTALVVET